jgi:16S rRNA processing protein RimM
MTSSSANRRAARPRKTGVERGARRPAAAAAVAPPAERIAVGRIAAAHGLRGEVTVEVLSDVADRFAPGAVLMLSLAGAPRRHLVVETSRPHASRHKDRLLVRFQGVEDRTGAEALRRGVLEVDAAAVPPAPDGSYYQFDLVGCRCEDRRAGFLGEVIDVVAGGGGDLLRVVGPAGRGDQPGGASPAASCCCRSSTPTSPRWTCRAAGSSWTCRKG